MKDGARGDSANVWALRHGCTMLDMNGQEWRHRSGTMCLAPSSELGKLSLCRWIGWWTASEIEIFEEYITEIDQGMEGDHTAPEARRRRGPVIARLWAMWPVGVTSPMRRCFGPTIFCRLYSLDLRSSLSLGFGMYYEALLS